MKVSSIAPITALLALAAPAPAVFGSPLQGDKAQSVEKRWWTNQIDLGYALVQGYKENGLARWNGIRFGTASRLQAPKTPETNRTLYTALNYGPSCWQAQNYNNQPLNANTSAYSEDCLFLNVVAPEDASGGSNLPVLVYIHGGGYELGNGEYTWENLAQDAKSSGHPVVVVSIQYRLGAHGFLAGTEMKTKGALNAGLLDQEFALRWVQDHIYDFGGDPGHVTIAGESAGGGSVMNQIIARGGNTQQSLGLSKPLFQGAIGSSVFLPQQFYYDDPYPIVDYQNLVNLCGCANASDQFSCISTVDELTFANASSIISSEAYYGFWLWVPVVDGVFLTERPTELINQKKFNVQNFVGLHNYDEGYIFTDPKLVNSDTSSSDSELDAAFDTWLSNYFPHLDPAGRQLISELYPISAYPRANSTFNRAKAVSGEGVFVCPTVQLGLSFGDNGYVGFYALNNSLHGADVITYTATNFSSYESMSFTDAWVGQYLSTVLTFAPNSNPLTNSDPYWPSANSSQQQAIFNATMMSNTAPAQVTIGSLDTYLDRTGLLSRCETWFSNTVARNIPI